MKILFFLVHPAKFHLFKHPINRLRSKGVDVDIAIVTKDILEELIKQEGWDYVNIFPEGRRIQGLPIIVGTLINFVKTLWRLFTLTGKKKYDLFVTDDSLPIIGKLRGIPTIFFIDNELTTVPEYEILLKTATNVLAPESVNLGKYESKKISFKGYKELAYLHPDYFKPDHSVVEKINPTGEKYFLLRVVSMTASHDRGIKGLTDERVRQIIAVLQPHGKVFISGERDLPADLEQHRLKINPRDILHVIYYAQLFVSDSGTMSSEAALLGTPAFMFHDFIGRLGVMVEKEKKYGLMFGYNNQQFDLMLAKIQDLVVLPSLKEEWKKKVEVMLSEQQDVTAFMIDLFENYKAR